MWMPGPEGVAGNEAPVSGPKGSSVYFLRAGALLHGTLVLVEGEDQAKGN